MSDILKKSVSEVNPGVDIGRSTFTDLSFPHTTTMNEGDLVPIYCEEVLPGDTFSVTTRSFVRMTTPIFPVMDNAYIDIFYFYVPNRLVWDHWKEFMGENTSAPWTQLTEYTVPQLKFDTQYNYIKVGLVQMKTLSARRGSVANYLGAPTTLYPDSIYSLDGLTWKQTTSSISDLPNRAYRLIWNEFFRSEAVEYPVAVYKDDSDRSYVDGSGSSSYAGAPLKVNRLFDFFSAVLPAPQQGPSVSAGLLTGELPVTTTSADYTDLLSNHPGMAMAWHNGVAWRSDSINTGNDSSLYIVKNTSGNPVRADSNMTASGTTHIVAPRNLAAQLRNLNFSSINQLREAFAIQRYEEQLARGGNRYREQIKAFFGVTIPDSTVQVPEYLGGQRMPVNIDQVLQTSSTDSVSPQGNTGAYSLTTAKDASFTKSFVEHGMIIGLACIRVSHTYPQAVRPFLYRKRRFDFYFPQFANLGEQPVLKKVICPTGIPQIDDQVFGYNEAFSDYRYRPAMLSGAFSPDVYTDGNGGLDERESSLARAWTYSDYYHLNYASLMQDHDVSGLTPPTLSPEWLSESDTNIQKTLAVQTEPQFLAQFDFEVTATRPMPVKSIPGLIDHH